MLTHEQCERLLSLLTSTGASYADVFVERRELTSLRLDAQQIEQAVTGTESGVGLRMVRGDMTYYASTNLGEFADLETLARELAAVSDPSALQPFLLREKTAAERNSMRIDPRTISLGEKLQLLQRADETARAASEKITQVAASYSDSVRDILVATSQGDLCFDHRVLVTFVVHAMASDNGEIQSGRKVVSGAEGWEFFERAENQPETLARLASQVALRNLEADNAPAGTFPVVLSSSAGGTMVHEACGHGLEGDFVKQGMSVYSGKIGERVASDLITVIDDGTLPQKRGTERFDDEGVETERVVLIERGILKRYLHSRKSAAETNMAPTGNGRRESFRFVPIPRMRNTIIMPGEQDPADIIASVDKGIFVAEMGGGEVDVVSGNFLFSITEGFLIENGRITKPIRGASLIGNGPEVLSTIDMIGRDLGYSVGTCGKDGQGVPVADAQPTLRIPAIVVGGITAREQS